MVKIRRCQKFTTYRTSEVANLNPEEFRNLEENPYTGQTDDDFINYIATSGFHVEVPFDLANDQTEELFKIHDAGVEWSEIEPDYKFRIQCIDSFLKNGGGKKEDLDRYVNEQLVSMGLEEVSKEILNIDLQEYYSSIIDENKVWLEFGDFKRQKGIAETINLDFGDETPKSTSAEDGC
jgi:hypothetical protein